MMLYAKDFGITPDAKDDMTFEITELMRLVADRGERELVLEKGEYHFYPDFAEERVCCISNNECDGFKKVVFLIENMHDFTIDANGSMFIFHGISIPFMVEHSGNITIKNVKIDYPKTMYAHSRVVEVGEKYCVIEPLDGESLSVTDGRLCASIEGCCGRVRWVIDIDPEERDIRYGTGDNVFGDWFDNMDVYAEYVGRNRIKLYGDAIMKTPPVGDIILLGFGQRYAPGFFINESSNINLENVTVYHCLGMGLLAQLSEDINLKKFDVLPSGGRYVSAYADGTHFVECNGNIILDECDIEGQTDDPLNCHGIYMQITKIVNSDTALAKFGHSDQMGLQIFRTGDKIEFIDSDTLLCRGKGVIKSVAYVSRSVCKIEFVKEIPQEVKISDCIENIEHKANLTVRNCRFARNRARGLLITTRGDVLVENNTFAMTGTAIRISGDANSWFESGCVRNILIKNNKFVNCNRCPWGRSVIDIDPEIKVLSDECYHQNVIISQNEFYTFTDSLVYAKSVEGLVFKDNRIIKNVSYKPIDSLQETVTTVNCKNYTIET